MTPGRAGRTGLGGVITAAVVGLIAALWTWMAPGDLTRWRAAPGSPGVELHLLDNGFHTDLAVPRAALEARGGPLAGAMREGDDARFFASRETFSIAHLCNHWTAGVLNAGGLPVRPFRSIVSAELLAAIDRAELDTAAPPA